MVTAARSAARSRKFERLPVPGLGALFVACYILYSSFLLNEALRRGCEGMANIPSAISVLPAKPLLLVIGLEASYCDLRAWFLAHLISAVIVYGAGSLLERAGRWVAGKLGMS